MEVSILYSPSHFLQGDLRILEFEVTVVLVLSEAELTGPPICPEDPLAGLLVIEYLNFVEGVVDALSILLVLLLDLGVLEKVFVLSLEHTVFVVIGVTAVNI